MCVFYEDVCVCIQCTIVYRVMCIVWCEFVRKYACILVYVCTRVFVRVIYACCVLVGDWVSMCFSCGITTRLCDPNR